MNRVLICSAKDDIVMSNHLILHNLFTNTVEDESKIH
jgi:hypothetical protein